MKWGKLGIVGQPEGHELSLSHCYIPTPIVLEHLGVVRVYYSSWDKHSRGRIFYVDLDINNLQKIIKWSDGCVLNIGEPGTFDSDGVSPQYAYLGEDKNICLLYQGFQRTVYPKINMMLAGLACGNESNDTMRRWKQTPFLERTEEEPFIRSATCLIIDDGLLRLWYTSGLTGWEPCKDKSNWDSYPKYDIAYIMGYSPNNLTEQKRILCNIKRPNELGVARPWVIQEDNKFKMWFSYRREDLPYRIGYAESKNGTDWNRFPDNYVGIKPGEWFDYNMVCFGAVVDVRGNRYMFYNGNGHGRDGFALAILEQD